MTTVSQPAAVASAFQHNAQQLVVRQIPLTQGKIALVDGSDFNLVSQHRWSTYQVRINGRLYGPYARGRIDGRQILIHRFIMGAVKGQIVDHIDGNPLNNQRSNLRFADHSQNMANRSRFVSKAGFKGVHETPHGFVARIVWRKKAKFLGRFVPAQEAADAYDAAAVVIHGEFAKTNASINEAQKPV